MKSMTGYGKSELHEDGKSVTVEIKSVNHRFLEATFRMPHILNAIEDELRRILKNKLFRGKIDIYISYRNNNDTSIKLSVNKPIISSYMMKLKEISKEYHFPFKPDLKTILELPDAFQKDSDENEDDAKYIVLKAFDDALDKFLNSRTIEGENLENDIKFHLDEIKKYMLQIEQRLPEIERNMRNKLREKIYNIVKEVSADNITSIDEDRLNMEIAYYTDRSCIDEELVRMASHIKAMHSEIKIGVNIGKKMDFMVQEMNREINTIGSKSADFDIASLVIAVKSEIEKIREQIQNVE